MSTAAFSVLDATFPAQHAALQSAYDTSLAAIPDGHSKDAGIEVGQEAASAMLAQGHDGRAGPVPPLPPIGPGYWQPMVGANGPLLDPSPWVANARPFLVKSASQFRTPGPNPLGSAAYARDLNEVDEFGAINSAVRTPFQTHAAVFWQTNPSASFNALARRLADERQLDITDSALLLGMMDLTAADALINCWNEKYYRGSWRPLAAMQVSDPTWRPLFDPSLSPAIAGVGPALITPPFPEHPSGHLSYTASSFGVLRAFFGTDSMSFFVTSSRFPGEQRYFSQFSDVVNEVLGARIWGGIHFRTADEQGMQLGQQVARWTRLHYFMPLH